MAKVVTKKPVRLTFCYLPDDEGVFRTSVLIPKKDKALIKQIEDAIDEAKEYGKGAKWGGIAVVVTLAGAGIWATVIAALTAATIGWLISMRRRRRTIGKAVSGSPQNTQEAGA